MGDQFDSSMNYDFRKNCKEFFALRRMDAFEFDARVTQMRMRYHKNMLYGQLNLLDSHDVSRFLSVCGEDLDRFRLAILFQMTFIGPPSVFYGDEQQIAGLIEEDYRSPMRWDEENEMFCFYQSAILLRKDHRALRRGEFRTIYAGKNNGLYIFERYTKEERIIIGLNSGKTDVKWDISLENKTVLLQSGFHHDKLLGSGYVIAKEESYDSNN